MREARSSKPLPARQPQGAPASIKPTPARDLASADARDVKAAAPPAGHSPAGHSVAAQRDIDEATVESDGSAWTVRVLGRSGRAEQGSHPLLLLGFWLEGGEGGHAREATVVGRALSELTPSRLEEALDRSTPPPQDGRRKPFFDVAGQGRRSIAPRGDP